MRRTLRAAGWALMAGCFGLPTAAILGPFLGLPLDVAAAMFATYASQPWLAVLGFAGCMATTIDV